jgi:hypothetical protein
MPLCHEPHHACGGRCDRGQYHEGKHHCTGCGKYFT